MGWCLEGLGKRYGWGAEVKGSRAERGSRGTRMEVPFDGALFELSKLDVELFGTAI